MALEAGKLVGKGVIVGRMGPTEMVGKGLGTLDEVVQALEAHHDMPSFLPRTGGVWGPFGPGQSLTYFTAQYPGMVLRVIKGAGRVEVVLATHTLAHGDWAFIPPGAEFRVVSSVMPGRELWVAISQLKRH